MVFDLETLKLETFGKIDWEVKWEDYAGVRNPSTQGVKGPLEVLDKSGAAHEIPIELHQRLFMPSKRMKPAMKLCRMLWTRAPMDSPMHDPPDPLPVSKKSEALTFLIIGILALGWGLPALPAIWSYRPPNLLLHPEIVPDYNFVLWHSLGLTVGLIGVAVGTLQFARRRKPDLYMDKSYASVDVHEWGARDSLFELLLNGSAQENGTTYGTYAYQEPQLFESRLKTLSKLPLAPFVGFPFFAFMAVVTALPEKGVVNVPLMLFIEPIWLGMIAIGIVMIALQRRSYKEMLASRDVRLIVTKEGVQVVGSAANPTRPEVKSGFAPAPSAAGYIRIAVPNGKSTLQFDPRYMTRVDTEYAPKSPVVSAVP